MKTMKEYDQKEIEAEEYLKEKGINASVIKAFEKGFVYMLASNGEEYYTPYDVM